MRRYKVAVIGAGIAGLVTAARLAKSGYQVVVLDKATTVGGSAGWYVRQGRMYPTGATIAFGLEPGGIFRRVLDELDVTRRLHIRTLTQPMEVLLPDRKLSIYLDVDSWRKELASVFHERASDVLAFWNALSQLALKVEGVTKTDVALPLRKLHDLGTLPAHLLRHPGHGLSLLKHMFQTVEDLMSKYHLQDYQPFRQFLNAQLVDAAQIDISGAALLPSSVALDIYRRGSFAVSGGLGAICNALAESIIEDGGEIWLANPATGMQRDSIRKIWEIRSRRFQGSVDVVVNGTGLDLQLNSETNLFEWQTSRDNQSLQGWGAYRVDATVDRNGIQSLLGEGADERSLPYAWQIVPRSEHSKLFGDEHGPVYFTLHPLLDAERVVMPDELLLTASVHTDLKQWTDLDKPSYQDKKHQFTNAIFEEFERVLPGIRQHVKHVHSGSPLTYRKFIGKVEVGGTPLTVRNAIFQPQSMYTSMSNLYTVGERVFPGPGTLSCALSGFYAARAIMHAFPVD